MSLWELSLRGVGGWGLFILILSLLGLIPLNVQAQKILFNQSRDPSLSLTIWGAQIRPFTSSGRTWDIRSQPDVFIRVYIGDQILRQSETISDQLNPSWAFTVGPIPESRFLEGPLRVQLLDQDLWGEELIEEFVLSAPTRREVGQVKSEQGNGVTQLSYQWGLVARAQSQNLEPRELRGVQLSSRQPSSDTTDDPTSHLNREYHRHSALQQARASRLYRVYLRAQFEGDQLEAHRILIKLAQRYPHSRHGRKAQRILLLDGR